MSTNKSVKGKYSIYILEKQVLLSFVLVFKLYIALSGQQISQPLKKFLFY